MWFFNRKEEKVAPKEETTEILALMNKKIASMQLQINMVEIEVDTINRRIKKKLIVSDEETTQYSSKKVSALNSAKDLKLGVLLSPDGTNI